MNSLPDRFRLDGRIALITGGAGHLGTTIAVGLAELGAAIVVLDRDPERCAETVARVEQAGGRGWAVAVDLEQEAEIRALPARIAPDTDDRLDVLINCAAFVGDTAIEGWAVPFEEQTSTAWRRAVEVNLTASFAMVQSFLPQLRRSERGSIINVGSIYGEVGPDWRLYEGTLMASPAAYAASKGGLMQLTRWLATTIAPKVRVNAVSPGGVARSQPASFVERYIDRVPLRRMATEGDIVGAVAFLAGDLSSYITGQNILVDGGWTAW